MKTTAAAMLAMVLVGPVYADSANAIATAGQEAGGKPMAWQSDWKEFATEYPKTEGQESRTEQYMEKDVVWKATVKKVTPPKEGRKSGTVELAMDPPLRLGDFSIETISLRPTDEEWPAWEEHAASQQVVFQTRLTGMVPWAKAPVMILRMNDASSFAQLSTRGGRLLKTSSKP